MDWKMFTGPLIGAVIGYCTNWIAVKMMFRPLHAKYIGKFRIPFTPGIIPKGQKNLANAIGNAVGNQLLTKEVLEAHLLSDDTKSMISSEVLSFLKRQENNHTSVKDTLKQFVGEQLWAQGIDKLKSYLAEQMEKKLIQANVAQLASNQMIDAMRQKVQGSLLAVVVNDNLLHSIGRQVEEGIDTYIAENGGTMIHALFDPEWDNLLGRPVSGIASAAEDYHEAICDVVVDYYEKAIKEKLPDMIRTIDFAGIARTRIEDMDVRDVEELVLSIMRNELNGVINLGALIGFILGLFNLLFYSL